MNTLRGLEPAFYLGMASVAKPRPFRSKELFELRPVRVVAGGTATFQSRVHHFFLDIVLQVHMTGKTEIGAGLYQQSFSVGLVRVVADRAVTRRHGAVDILEVRLVRMA